MSSWTRESVVRLAGLLVLCALVVVATQPPTLHAQALGSPIILAEVDGIINPLTASYVERVLFAGEEQGAGLVVLTLDTPGGVETAMREVVQHLLESPVPVAVYVAPQGARATSAGLFILLAGHIAAMAPATHVGAAHPVALGVELDDVQATKILSDSAALARSIAERRDRNADWAERAVRDNLSLTATEAQAQGVADIIADDLDALLTALDGRSVAVSGQSAVLATSTAPRRQIRMNLAEQVMQIISDPNIAYLLLTLGMLFLLAEIADPGLGFGAAGSIIAFVLAFLALGSLPVNWAGVALLGAGVALFVVGIVTDTEVIVTLTGIIPFVFGSLLLFSPFAPVSPSAPNVRVSPWLIGGMSGLVLLTSIGVLRAAVRASKLPPQSGPERLIGLIGTALTELSPTGQIRVDQELWSAISVAGEIAQGASIEVVGVSGVRLQVKPANGALPTEKPEEP
jgi:membrane-bound serine protease (ClpP class)